MQPFQHLSSPVEWLATRDGGLEYLVVLFGPELPSQQAMFCSLRYPGLQSLQQQSDRHGFLGDGLL